MHVLRDVLGHVPKTAQAMVAAFSRTVFAQPDAASAHAQLGAVVERLAPSFPKAADTLLRAETDLLAYLAVPREHWSKVWSTNPIERLNRELARRNDVVGIFPNRDALVRLGGALLAEQHDEWLTDGSSLPAPGVDQPPPWRRPQPDPRRPAQGGHRRLRTTSWKWTYTT